MFRFGFHNAIRPTPIWMFGGDYVDPVPDFIFNYRLDGNDPALTPINSPLIVAGLDLPDQLSTSFNGVDQYISSPDASLINVGTGAWSMSMRFMMSSVGDAMVLVSTGSGTSAGHFRLRVQTTGKLQFKTANIARSSSTAFSANSWKHLVITSTGAGGTLEFFVNGSNYGTLASPSYNWTGGGSLQLAAEVGVGVFKGEIDDYRFYDRALTPAEITALYNNKE